MTLWTLVGDKRKRMLMRMNCATSSMILMVAKIVRAWPVMQMRTQWHMRITLLTHWMISVTSIWTIATSMVWTMTRKALMRSQQVRVRGQTLSNPLVLKLIISSLMIFDPDFRQDLDKRRLLSSHLLALRAIKVSKKMCPAWKTPRRHRQPWRTRRLTHNITKQIKSYKVHVICLRIRRTALGW